MIAGTSDTAAVNDCYFSTETITVINGVITIGSVSPSGSIVGRGPTSYHETIAVNFSTEFGIPTNGKIIIVIDNNWEATMETC